MKLIEYTILISNLKKKKIQVHRYKSYIIFLDALRDLYLKVDRHLKILYFTPNKYVTR